LGSNVQSSWNFAAVAIKLVWREQLHHLVLWGGWNACWHTLAAAVDLRSCNVCSAFRLHACRHTFFKSCAFHLPRAETPMVQSSDWTEVLEVWLCSCSSVAVAVALQDVLNLLPIRYEPPTCCSPPFQPGLPLSVHAATSTLSPAAFCHSSPSHDARRHSHPSPSFISPLPSPLLLRLATPPAPSPVAGVPPCVLSFVHPPGRPHALPSATHTDIASMWEEPCLAFVRLVVSSVDLGPAAAMTAAVAADGSSDAVSSRSSKAVLQRLTGLLRGDTAVEEVGGGLELGF